MLSLNIGLAVLVILALALVLWALRKPATVGAGDLHRLAQRGFYNQRRRELAEDFANGLIDEVQRQELENELDRQVLDETQNSEGVVATVSRTPWLGAAFAALIALVSLGLYSVLGYREDLLLQQIQREIIASGDVNEAAVDRYQAVLADIVDKRPDAEHLVAMAGLLRQRGDFAAALPYYQALLDLYPQDPEVMAQVGQARYMAAGRRLDSETRALLEQAIAVEPRQVTALGVLGIDAFESGEYLRTLDYWQRLVSALPGGSPQQALIASGINEAKRRAAEQGTLFSIPVTVDFADGATGTGGMLFVVAREPGGMPMPVAALRLPLNSRETQHVFLTDSDVIRQGKGLRDFAELQVSAHISFSGTAMRRPGDWGAEPITVDVEAPGEIRLLINTKI